MADRQRWFWGPIRAMGRNEWTSAGTFAVLTLLGGVVADVLTYRSGGMGEPHRPWDLAILIALTSAFSLLFWLGMAAVSVAQRRKDGALAGERLAEQIAGIQPRSHRIFRVPRLRWFVVAGVVFGSLELAGGQSALTSLASGASWIVAGMLLRWAWPAKKLPGWKLATASVGWGVLAAVVDATSVGDHRGSLGHAVSQGATWAGISAVSMAIVHRSMGPGRHSVVLRALRVRERALVLASDGTSEGEGAAELLRIASGSRAAMEGAREFLRRRPADETASRALSLIDRAIDAADWPRWPWSRAALP